MDGGEDCIQWWNAQPIQESPRSLKSFSLKSQAPRRAHLFQLHLELPGGGNTVSHGEGGGHELCRPLVVLLRLLHLLQSSAAAKGETIQKVQGELHLLQLSAAANKVALSDAKRKVDIEVKSLQKIVQDTQKDSGGSPRVFRYDPTVVGRSPGGTEAEKKKTLWDNAARELATAVDKFNMPGGLDRGGSLSGM